MRTVAVLVCLLGIAVSAPVCAQAPAPAPALPIPLPPGAAVQMELDSRDGDLLGMVKGLLAGAATPKTGAGAGAANANPFANFLSDGQLTALLKDIHHLHVLSFKSGNGAAAPAGQTADLLTFYEKPFEAEGGHRMLYLSEQKVVAVGFDQPRGFALAAVQSLGSVIVVRADGYPDMTVLGGLLRTFGGLVPGLPTMTPPTVSAPTPAARPAPRSVPKTPAKARRG